MKCDIVDCEESPEYYMIISDEYICEKHYQDAIDESDLEPEDFYRI